MPQKIFLFPGDAGFPSSRLILAHGINPLSQFFKVFFQVSTNMFAQAPNVQTFRTPFNSPTNHSTQLVKPQLGTVPKQWGDNQASSYKEWKQWNEVTKRHNSVHNHIFGLYESGSSDFPESSTPANRQLPLSQDQKRPHSNYKVPSSCLLSDATCPKT